MTGVGVNRGLVVVDLIGTGRRLTEDGVVALFGFAQGYVAGATQDTLDEIVPSPVGLSILVAPSDRPRVIAALRTILKRPGMVRTTANARHQGEEAVKSRRR